MTARRCVFLAPDSRCNHAAVDGPVRPEDCARCDFYAGPLRGMGDAFHVALTATGVASAVHAIAGDRCNCGERRAAMNRALPFADKDSENATNGNNL